MNSLLITSPLSQAPQFSLEPKLPTVQNQNTTSYSCQNVCVKGECLPFKANIRKVENMHITVIQGKYKASKLKKKMHKFPTLFKIFVSLYYELKLKGFSHLEIFLNKYKAINLGSDLVVSIKKNGKNNPVDIYC